MIEAKALLATPALFLLLTSGINGPDAWTIVWWAVGGSAVGGYCAAGWELIGALAGAQVTDTARRWWWALAGLRLSVSMGIGLMLSLLAAAQMTEPHPWGVAGLAFLFALAGLALKPWLDRAVVNKLKAMSAQASTSEPPK